MERHRVEEMLEMNMSLEAELKHSQGQSRRAECPLVESDDELRHENEPGACVCELQSMHVTPHCGLACFGPGQILLVNPAVL